MDVICLWIAETVPLFATLFSLVYGIKHFFKKGKPLCAQSITMAMASHAVGSIYHLCQTLTSEYLVDGFTPAYLGRIGFFLFLLTASYGQLDRIVDDRSPVMRPAKFVALIAPLLAILLYIPNAIINDVPIATKIMYAIVWIPATISVYFNLKHSLIPDLDFGFVKAIRPYNILATCLGLSELLCLTAWDYYYPIPLAITAILFGALAISTIVALKKGVEKWTI